MRTLLPFFLSFSILIQPSQQFAAWLVDRKSSCFVELREPGEIIMNFPVTPATESAHSNDVYIQVFAEDDVPVPVKLREEADGTMTRVIYIHHDDKASSSATTTKKYKLKLQTPQNLQDLQYVMDAMILPPIDDYGDNNKSDGTSSKLEGTFTGPTKGCDGNRRAHGRVNDDGVDFQVEIPVNFFFNKSTGTGADDATKVEDAVEVVAGWACGHETVTLTHPILFLPASLEEKDENSSAGVIPSTAVEDTTMTEKKLKDKSIVVPSKKNHDGQNKEEEEKQNIHFPEEINVIKNEEKTTNKLRGNKQQRLKSEQTAIRRFRERYNKEEFAKATFSAHGYIMGIVSCILLFIMVRIRAPLVAWWMRKASIKGRRD